jgi:large subunit ribosomal protein L9
VRPGYARNFLLPRGLAGQPTPGAIKRLAERRAQVEAEMKARRAVLEGMLEKMAGHEITLMRSANEQGVLFGGISQHDITEAMLADGFTIEDRMVRIGQQIKRLDSYHIPIVLASDLKTEIKLWVVSDKPSENQEAGKDQERKTKPVETETEPEEEEAEPVAEQASASAEKPRRVRKEKAAPKEKAPKAKSKGKAAEAEAAKE